MEETSNAKHIAAFLGAPVGAYALGAVIWLAMKETCSEVATAIECVQVGGVRYSLSEVMIGATILAVLGAFAIEVAVGD